MKMSDLAKLAGVSKSTVSRALANSEVVSKDTREKVKALAETHGYRMNMRARNFRMQSTLTIGVLLPSNGSSNWVASNPFTLEMLGFISDELELRGHELLLAKHSGDNPLWIEEFARTRSVDGIIVLGQSIYHDVINEVASWYKNIIVWGAELPDQTYTSLGSDNYQGGVLAAKEMIQKKRKRITFLGNLECPETQLRYKGFKTTLIKHDPDLQPNVLTCRENQNDQAKKIITANLKANSDSFDGIFASSDMLAISAIKSIQNLGLNVPNDVSVIGYDNITIARFITPALTTISQNESAAGKLLIDKLFTIMEGKPSPNEKLKTELMQRDST